MRVCSSDSHSRCFTSVSSSCSPSRRASVACGGARDTRQQGLTRDGPNPPKNSASTHAALARRRTARSAAMRSRAASASSARLRSVARSALRCTSCERSSSVLRMRVSAWRAHTARRQWRIARPSVHVRGGYAGCASWRRHAPSAAPRCALRAKSAACAAPRCLPRTRRAPRAHACRQQEQAWRLAGPRRHPHPGAQASARVAFGRSELLRRSWRQRRARRAAHKPRGLPATLLRFAGGRAGVSYSRTSTNEQRLVGTLSLLPRTREHTPPSTLADESAKAAALGRTARLIKK